MKSAETSRRLKKNGKLSRVDWHFCLGKAHLHISQDPMKLLILKRLGEVLLVIPQGHGSLWTCFDVEPEENNIAVQVACGLLGLCTILKLSFLHVWLHGDLISPEELGIVRNYQLISPFPLSLLDEIVFFCLFNPTQSFDSGTEGRGGGPDYVGTERLLLVKYFVECLENRFLGIALI